MDDKTEKAAILLGNALKPNFAEMDEVFRKHLPPALEQTVTEKVDAMSMEELEYINTLYNTTNTGKIADVSVRRAGVVENKQFVVAEDNKHWRTEQ